MDVSNIVYMVMYDNYDTNYDTVNMCMFKNCLKEVLTLVL